MAKWIKARISEGGLAEPEHTRPGMGNNKAAPHADSGAKTAGLHEAKREPIASVRAERLYGPKKAVKF